MNKKEFDKIFSSYIISQEDLKTLHRVLLEMLSDVDKICRENDIKYSLGGGTLLGAMRHKGFIPWDDDVDVMMPYDDYVKFIQIVKEKYNENYYIADIREGTASTLFVKFCKKGTKFVEINSVGTPFSNNIFIDIFPMEYCPDDEKERKKRGKKFNLFRKMKLCAISYKYPSKLLLEKTKESKILKKEYNKKRFIGFFCNLLSIRYLVKKCDKLAHYTKKGKYVVCPFGARYYDFELYNSDLFDELIEVPFEDKKFFITHRYEDYLKLMYGDYMKMPSEENRKPTHVIEVKEKI